MATINFQYRGIKDIGKLSVRLIHGEIDHRVSSPIVSKKEYWFKRTSKNGKTVVKQRKLNELNFNEEVKNHKKQLEDFSGKILKAFENDFNSGVPISRQWLNSTISKVVPMLESKSAIKKVQQGVNEVKLAEQKKNELVYKSNLISDALEKMDIKYATNVDELKKFKVLSNLFSDFQEQQNQIFKTVELNQDFADRFMNWGLLEMELSKSYINAVLMRLRRAVVNSYENDDDNIIEVSKKLRTFKMFKNPYKGKIIVFLNYEELDKIDDTILSNKKLEDAKKAILIGCETGLRYNDFNKLNDLNLKNVKGIDCWEFENEKTGAIVRIPKHKRILSLLNKYGLPKTDYPADEKKLNEDVKAVCRIAKLNYLTEGYKTISKMINGKKRKRNVKGFYPKYKLVATRTFRRSFATNYIGKIDSEFIRSITGHKTEKALRIYANQKDDSNVINTVEQIDNFHNNRTKVKKLHLEVVKETLSK